MTQIIIRQRKCLLTRISTSFPKGKYQRKRHLRHLGVFLRNLKKKTRNNGLGGLQTCFKEKSRFFQIRRYSKKHWSATLKIFFFRTIESIKNKFGKHHCLIKGLQMLNIINWICSCLFYSPGLSRAGFESDFPVYEANYLSLEPPATVFFFKYIF